MGIPNRFMVFSSDVVLHATVCPCVLPTITISNDIKKLMGMRAERKKEMIKIIIMQGLILGDSHTYSSTISLRSRSSQEVICRFPWLN